MCSLQAPRSFSQTEMNDKTTKEAARGLQQSPQGCFSHTGEEKAPCRRPHWASCPARSTAARGRSPSSRAPAHPRFKLYHAVMLPCAHAWCLVWACCHVAPSAAGRMMRLMAVPARPTRFCCACHITVASLRHTSMPQQPARSADEPARGGGERKHTWT